MAKRTVLRRIEFPASKIKEKLAELDKEFAYREKPSPVLVVRLKNGQLLSDVIYIKGEWIKGKFDAKKQNFRPIKGIPEVNILTFSFK